MEKFKRVITFKLQKFTIGSNSPTEYFPHLSKGPLPKKKFTRYFLNKILFLSYLMGTFH